MTWRHRSLAGSPIVAAIGTWALWVSGSQLPRPRSTTVAGLRSWYLEAGAGGAAAGLVWMTGLAIAAWLTLALALQVASCWCSGLRRTADALAPAAVRGLAPALAGLSLSASLTVAAAAPGAAADPAPMEAEEERAEGTATMTRVEPTVPPSTVAPTTTTTSEAPEATGPPPSTPATSTPAPTVPPSTTTTTTAAAAAGDAPAGPTGSPSAPPAVAVPVPEPAPSPPPPSPHASTLDDTIVVEPGMSFWSIAEETLLDAGRPSTERDIARYWRTLIEANLDRLVAAGNPDLLLPGQELRLPAP